MLSYHQLPSSFAVSDARVSQVAHLTQAQGVCKLEAAPLIVQTALVGDASGLELMAVGTLVIGEHSLKRGDFCQPYQDVQELSRASVPDHDDHGWSQLAVQWVLRGYVVQGRRLGEYLGCFRNPEIGVLPQNCSGVHALCRGLCAAFLIPDERPQRCEKTSKP